MDNQRWQTIQLAFFAALDLPESEREGAIRESCSGDEDLMRQVRAMLASENEANAIVDDGIAAIAATMLGSARESLAAMEFGPYALKDFLGEGGMGIVYLARHRENGKLVAIKILLDARLSPARRKRFAREQRMLASLNHRNIAHLYHSDVLADETPWFAMEFIGAVPEDDGVVAKALSIDEYCRQHQCSIEQRIRLMRSVCEGVQHVHSHMLVHRDLKPSNILVAADGTPKLIDFGIGKEQEDEDTPSDRTEPGLRLMTIAYAAPEQLQGAPALPATDIYSLGVILYKLLAGAHPFDLAGCSTPQAEQKILEVEPRKPSAAARTTGNSSLTDKSRWADLDALCRKAMHKDPEMRYATVGAMIDDLDSFLAGRPLKARPDGFGYRAGKFVRRNRRAIAVSAVVVFSIVSLVAYYTLRLARARNAAVAEAARSERIEKFTVEMLRNGDSEGGPPEQMHVSELIDRGVKEARGLGSEPRFQVDLYQTLGDIYESWGKSAPAQELLNASLEQRKSIFGADSPQVAEGLVHLAMWYDHQDQLPKAEQTINLALAMQRRRLADDDPAIARALTVLGDILQRLGRQDEAISAVRHAIQIQSRSPALRSDLSESVGLLAGTQFYLGHYAESEQLTRQALELDKALHGDRHPAVAEDLISLGNISLNLEHPAEAETDYRQALEIKRAWYGPDHPQTADAITYVAQALQAENKLKDAQTLLQQALASLDRSGGPPQMRVAHVLNQLGVVENLEHNTDAAEADFKRSASIYEAVYGRDHWETALAVANIGTAYLAVKDYPMAEQYFRDALARYARASAADPMNVGIAHIKLGRTLVREKRYRDGAVESLAGYKLVAKEAEPTSSWLQAARTDLVEDYEALHEPEKAAVYRAEMTAVARAKQK
jgi:serine/threonine-protein kinase